MIRIAIVGPGAVGGTMAAWLGTRRDLDLTACARTALSSIEVVAPERTLTVAPRVLTNPHDATPVDWVFVATKTYDAAATALWFPTLGGARTRFAILQNGVEHVGRFSPYAPAERILPVMVDCPAERTGPGRIRQRGAATLVVPHGEAGLAFADLFAGTEVDVRTTADWTTAAWRKLAVNAAGGVSAVTLRPAGVVTVPEVADVMRGIVREVVAVGRAQGASLGDEVVEAVIDGYRGAPPDSVNSLHADRLAGRPMESDARNGVVVRLGRQFGIPTPYNESVLAYLRAAESPGGNR